MLVNQNLDPRMLVAIHQLTHAKLALYARWPELPDEGRITEPVFDPRESHPCRELVKTIGQAATAANGLTVQGWKPSVRSEGATANRNDRGSQAQDRPCRCERHA